MVLKSEKESRLLALSKQFDAGLQSHDLSEWVQLLAPDVVLHKDSVTLSHDLRGQKVVKAYFQAYIDRYNYEHSVIAGAVDESDNVAFSFSVDTGVAPKGDVYKEQHQKGEVTPGTTYGVYYLVFNSEEKVQEIYFLRQLTEDEAHRKLKTVPDYSKLSIDPAKYKGSAAQDEARAQKHEKAAATYNKIWATGDHSAADQIFAKGVVFQNVVYGGKQQGVDSFKSMIDGIFKEYEVHDQKSAVAVTPSDKAFIWWSVQGHYKGDWSNNYGISFLEFNKEDKIEEVLTWMQPLPEQRRELVK